MDMDGRKSGERGGEDRRVGKVDEGCEGVGVGTKTALEILSMAWDGWSLYLPCWCVAR